MMMLSTSSTNNNKSNQLGNLIFHLFTAFVIATTVSWGGGGYGSVHGALFAQNHEGPWVPSLGNQGGLLARSSPSKRPTPAPTVKPTEPTQEPIPTASPTESPAPSPSPSANPTADPDKITFPPTAAPTESPAPSPSPSDVPTRGPSSAPSQSVVPSAAPTATPSRSPSAAPSSTPSDVPSLTPSSAPSFSPTTEAHKTKTALTTLLLEEIPYEMDYFTAAEFEVVTLEFLQKKIRPELGIDGYDLDMVAVNVLHQTVILPENAETGALADTDAIMAVINPAIDPIPNNSTRRQRQRQLESETWSIALEVKIRTVGVVQEGRVLDSFNFTRMVDLAFYEHWDQYLWQLGSSLEFFAPLLQVSDWKPQQQMEARTGKNNKDNDKNENEDPSTLSFLMAILFSGITLCLAVAASYVAIRKHLRTHPGGRAATVFSRNGGATSVFRTGRRKSGGVRVSPKNDPSNYSGPDVIDYLAKTCSSESDNPKSNRYHDGDVEGGGALAFVKNMSVDVNVEIDEHNLQEIALSPAQQNAHYTGVSPSGTGINHQGLFVVDEEDMCDEHNDDDDHQTNTSKKSGRNSNSNSNPRGGTITNIDESLPDQQSIGFGGQIRKWLTPTTMMNSGVSGGQHVYSTTPVDIISDHHDHDLRAREPEAVKASTKHKTGVYTSTTSASTSASASEKSVNRNMNINMNSGENTNTDTNHPSTKSKNAAAKEEGQFTMPISFFSNHGTDGGENDDSPMSSLADSNASSFFAVGNMNEKSFTARRSSAANGNLSVRSGEIDYLPDPEHYNHQHNYDHHNYRDQITGGIDQHHQQKQRDLTSENVAHAYKLPKSQPQTTTTTVTNTNTNNIKPNNYRSNSIMHTMSTDSTDSVVQRTIAQLEEKKQQKARQQQQQQHQHQNQPLREIQPANHSQSHHASQSSVGIEMTLGATSRDQNEEEQRSRNNSNNNIRITPTYLQNRSVFSPTRSGQHGHGHGYGHGNTSTKSNQSNGSHGGYGYGHNKKVVQQQGRFPTSTKSSASASTLGARPMEERLQVVRDRDNNYNNGNDNDDDDRTTVSTILHRSGSYVVYAPSGQIGIVVDTSRGGPSVHSLKETSPMRGLITPGDLIVALDGEDTRSLSAAALTRLMAKKSRQKERKIMLYAPPL
mmetsp:Transcript_37818/g.43522  ORF Transcript_37818/g.43522 Transcript_37818/m.43522 type:complete len:1145 (-) Transcript_37818:170-3604(-)